MQQSTFFFSLIDFFYRFVHLLSLFLFPFHSFAFVLQSLEQQLESLRRELSDEQRDKAAALDKVSLLTAEAAHNSTAWLSTSQPQSQSQVFTSRLSVSADPDVPPIEISVHRNLAPPPAPRRPCTNERGKCSVENCSIQ